MGSFCVQMTDEIVPLSEKKHVFFETDEREKIEYPGLERYYFDRADIIEAVERLKKEILLNAKNGGYMHKDDIIELVRKVFGK